MKTRRSCIPGAIRRTFGALPARYPANYFPLPLRRSVASSLRRSGRERGGPLCVLAIALATFPILGSTCEGDHHHDDDPLSGRVSVELQNYSDEFVHMLGPGESISKDNELWPFDADPSTLEDKRFIFVNEGNLAVTIRAGHVAGELIEVTCELPGNGLNDAEFLTVNYTSIFRPRLTCVLQ